MANVSVFLCASSHNLVPEPVNCSKHWITEKGNTITGKMTSSFLKRNRTRYRNLLQKDLGRERTSSVKLSKKSMR